MRTTPVDKLVAALQKEIERLETAFPDDYRTLKDRLDRDDAIGIYQWLIKNRELIEPINAGKPVRFEAYDPARSGRFAPKVSETAHYPFPITIYINTDNQGIYVDFDLNSKLARDPKNPAIKKDTSRKKDGNLKKFINSGSDKVVRMAWSFNTYTGRIEDSVALVSKGLKSIEKFRREFKMNQPSNPLLWHARGFMEYQGHNPDDKSEQPKAIAFARRAGGDLFDLVIDMVSEKRYRLDLGDILWMSYAAIKAVALYNATGRWHRDVKLENFLFSYNKYGLCIYLTDFGASMDQKESLPIAGTPEYLAFDHSMYQLIIEYHQAILGELTKFEKAIQEDVLPRTIVGWEGYGAKYQDFLELLGSAPAARLAYMKFRLQPKIEKEVNGIFSKEPEDIRKIIIENLLKTMGAKNSGIQVSPDNHPTQETSAVCTTLKSLIEYFCAYAPTCKSSQIIVDLRALLNQNLFAGFASRMTTSQLLTAVEKLFSQWLLQPANQTYRQKFSAQLECHNLKLPGLTTGSGFFATSVNSAPPSTATKTSSVNSK